MKGFVDSFYNFLALSRIAIRPFYGGINMQSPVEVGEWKVRMVGSKLMSWKFQVSISISKLGKGRKNRWWSKNQWFDTIVGLPGKMISRIPRKWLRRILSILTKNCCMVAVQ